MASKKSYTLLEYLVTIEKQLKDLKIILDNNIGTDYSEILNNTITLKEQFNTIGPL